MQTGAQLEVAHCFHSNEILYNNVGDNSHGHNVVFFEKLKYFRGREHELHGTMVLPFDTQKIGDIFNDIFFSQKSPI